MNNCSTVFHSLLRLTKEYIPHHLQVEFYKEVLKLLGESRIRLDFLIGEHEKFDEAHKQHHPDDKSST